MKNLEDAMTVGELRARLKDFDDDTPVLFSYNYGDHWHSQVASDIRDVCEDNVKWSEYHQMFKIPSSERDDDDECTEVVVISG
jgi:hypothetical protein